MLKDQFINTNNKKKIASRKTKYKKERNIEMCLRNKKNDKGVWAGAVSCNQVL